MTSTWKAMPEASLASEPRSIGELTHSSRCSWWPGVRPTPKNGAPATRQHEMAGERRPVPAQQPDRLLLDQAGLEVEQQVAHARRGLAGGELEGSQLLDLIDDPEALGRVHQEVGGVYDPRPVAD